MAPMMSSGRAGGDAVQAMLSELATLGDPKKLAEARSKLQADKDASLKAKADAEKAVAALKTERDDLKEREKKVSAREKRAETRQKKLSGDSDAVGIQAAANADATAALDARDGELMVAENEMKVRESNISASEDAVVSKNTLLDARETRLQEAFSAIASVAKTLAK